MEVEYLTFGKYYVRWYADTREINFFAEKAGDECYDPFLFTVTVDASKTDEEFLQTVLDCQRMCREQEHLTRKGLESYAASNT